LGNDGTDTGSGFPNLSGWIPAGSDPTIREPDRQQDLGNKVASGTEIIQELGAEHMQTGYPIVYTSADSVFQIAAHEEIIPLERLVRNVPDSQGDADRRTCRGTESTPGPFIGKPGQFTRTANRHDFSLQPPRHILDRLLEDGCEVIGVGKIKDIFAGRGVSQSYSTANNQEGIDRILEAMQRDFGV
jgi:phosphopentomutase